MTTPPPVDLSRLGSILGKAAAVMNKVESNAPTTPSKQILETYEDDYYEAPAPRSRQQTTPIYNDNDEKEMNFENYSHTPAAGSSNVYNYSDEQIKNSKMPESIKRLMAEKRMPKYAAPPSKYTAEDIAKAAGIQLKGTQQPLTETVKRTANQGDMVTVSKTQLNEMVNSMVEKKLLEYFTKSYNKLVTQETVKATITTLIREGKIVPKKKTL